MWIGIAGIILACGTALAACGGDDEDTGESTASLCAKACAASDALACPDEPPNCESDCASTFDAIPASCASQGRALLECGANTPASDLECDADGESGFKAGVCDAEERAALECLGVPSGTGGSGGTGGGGAGGGGAGGGGGTGGAGPDSCGFANDGECDEPDFCPVGTDTTDCAQ
jgi:hypothetical protein